MQFPLEQELLFPSLPNFGNSQSATELFTFKMGKGTASQIEPSTRCIPQGKMIAYLSSK